MLNFKVTFTGRYDESKAIITRISVANRTSLSEELITRMFKAVNDESNSNQKMVNTRVRDMLKYKYDDINTKINFD